MTIITKIQTNKNKNNNNSFFTKMAKASSFKTLFILFLEWP